MLSSMEFRASFYAEIESFILAAPETTESLRSPV